ncbi:cytochrome-c peroxidase [Campylobacter sp. 19-13652]|uniref:cytochrome-c peroxidase n=1 Tax=Campylobacter sp. 19-13652 TaxID=2840180 RepID=UPI001C74ABD6|nr:cytochrome-c peroxidase [Campylobacter sp. 19-13652]BCX78915.1 cytochrome c biogenesis protein CcsA [Campylobacter sp. 19-13652]
MKLRSIALSAVLISSLSASKLIDEAKEAGLTPIPTDKKELAKLINEAAPDSLKYPTTTERVELGKALYFDPRISRSGIISCNTCHNLGLGGSDGVPASTGHKWTPNPHHLNAPTVLNSVFNSAQFWDGRAAHLADQAQGPIQASPEMAATPDLVEARVKSMPEYAKLFKKAYGENVKIDFALVATTIGIFERTLVTPSRFDEFLEGKESALNTQEKAGLKLFLDKGCVTCHGGINLGGTLAPFEVANKYKFASVGDFKGDANGMVKAPTLRNVELTAPYFHNGVIWSLAEAVKTMGSVQLGVDINDKEAADIVAFLKSLTGKLENISYPMLPVSTDATPKPELDY